MNPSNSNPFPAEQVTVKTRPGSRGALSSVELSRAVENGETYVGGPSRTYWGERVTGRLAKAALA